MLRDKGTFDDYERWLFEHPGQEFPEKFTKENLKPDPGRVKS